MSIINKNIRKAIAYNNGNCINISDEDLKGKWSVIFFYPANFIFVCPTDFLDLSENYSIFKHFTHKAWHDRYYTISKSKYPMICAGIIYRNFNVLIKETGLFEWFDTEGKNKIAEYNGICRNSKELIRKNKATQYINKYPYEVQKLGKMDQKLLNLI